MPHVNPQPGSPLPSAGGRPETGDRERGSALVTVLLFGLALMSLALLLLTTSESNVRSQSNSGRRQVLFGVCKAGLAQSLTEIRRNLIVDSDHDPDGDGVGAILGAGNAGVALRDSRGAVLGVYRVTVRSDAGRTILTAVAGYPDLTAPRELVSLEATIRTETEEQAFLVGDRYPLSIAGPVGEDFEADFMSNRSAMTAYDPNNEVPAVNVSDSTTHEAFLDALSEHEDNMSLLGADLGNPGAGGTGSDTVSNNPSGTLSEETMRDIDRALQDYVDTKRADPSSQSLADYLNGVSGINVNGNPNSVTMLGGEANIPEGTYYLDKHLYIQNGSTIRGSGTLIVSAKLKGLSSATFEWDGDVIVVGTDAGVEMHSRSSAKIDGVLALSQFGGRKAEIQLLSGASLEVDGALLMLNEERSKLELHNDTRLEVRGIFANLAQEHDLWAHDRSQLKVDGSMMFMVPSDTGGTVDWEARQTARLDFTFDGAAFDESLEHIGAVAGGAFSTAQSDTLGSVEVTATWEVVGTQGLTTQAAQLLSGQAGLEVDE